MKTVTIINPKDFIIIRTPSVWYGVSADYVFQNEKRHPIFKLAAQMIRDKEKSKKAVVNEASI